jgi:hypothetical protein
MRSLSWRCGVLLSWPVAMVVASSACRAPQPAPQAPVQEPARTVARPRHAFHDLAAEQWKTTERDDDMDPLIPPFDPLHGAGHADQLKAAFRGKDRAVAKTSAVTGVRVERFASLADLQAAIPADEDMLHHDPELTRESMKRTPEEQRMVHVDAWIYAIKYESDNDWHVIAGTDPDGDEIHYFNAEISGLPKKQAPAFAALRAVRESLSTILDADFPGPGSYRKYDPAIAVTIEGALFYDIDHAPGAVGPGDMKPTTAWEIHPITRLAER